MLILQVVARGFTPELESWLIQTCRGSGYRQQRSPNLTGPHVRRALKNLCPSTCDTRARDAIGLTIRPQSQSSHRALPMQHEHFNTLAHGVPVAVCEAIHSSALSCRTPFACGPLELRWRTRSALPIGHDSVQCSPRIPGTYPG